MNKKTNALAEALAASTRPRRARVAIPGDAPRMETPSVDSAVIEPPVGDTEQMAAAVDVLARPDEGESVPARDPSVNAAPESVVEPTRLTRRRSKGGPLETLKFLTQRHNRSGAPGGTAPETRSVTITIPPDLSHRLKTVSDQVLSASILGAGAHKLNRSALLEEAARRYTNAPARYVAVIRETITAQPRLAGTVDMGTWDAMLSAWSTDPNRSGSHGPHLAAAVEEILNDVVSALSVEEHATSA